MSNASIIRNELTDDIFDIVRSFDNVWGRQESQVESIVVGGDTYDGFYLYSYGVEDYYVGSSCFGSPYHFRVNGNTDQVIMSRMDGHALIEVCDRIRMRNAN